MQKSPLLNYRKKCKKSCFIEDESLEYEFLSGLWISGELPLVEKYTNNDKNFIGKTLVTESREGVDRAEISSEGLKSNINSLYQSIITYTRESIDRSEKS